MDHHVGRLLNYFKKKELFDNTIVILSADHGESMMEHEKWFTHGYHVYNEIIHVPFLICYPDKKIGKREKTRVSLVDIVPTLLNILKIKPERELRGQILDDNIEDRPIFSQGHNKRSMIFKNGKWVIEVAGNKKNLLKTSDTYYFDLNNDPLELNRLQWGNKTKEVESFRQLILSDPSPSGFPKRFKKGKRITAPKVRPGLDDKTMNKLRSLGYVD